jgi:DNA-binding response OmpR family regulator
MSSVLLIDDDTVGLEISGLLLRHEGFQVLTADSGAAALRQIAVGQVDLVLADLRLPDVSGLELLRIVRARGLTIPYVILTGFGTIDSAVDALKSGATDYVQKPLIGDDLVQVVLKALAKANAAGPTDICEPIDVVPHALDRWARAIVCVVRSPKDPRTVRGWADACNVSAGALRNWCSTARLRPKRSLDFARLLRAVVRSAGSRQSAENLLDAVDRRTLSKLLCRGGIHQQVCDSSLDKFLDGQTLIQNLQAVEVVKRLMST